MQFKKCVNVLSMASLVALSATVVASADDTGIKLKSEQIGDNSVDIVLEDVGLIGKAYQLSLKIEGNVKLDTFNLTGDGLNGTKANYVYNESENLIDIYVTSTGNIVDDKGNLPIGVLTVNGTEGQTFNVVPVGDSFKIVSMSNVAQIVPNVTPSEEGGFVVKSTNQDSTSVGDTVITEPTVPSNTNGTTETNNGNTGNNNSTTGTTVNQPVNNQTNNNVTTNTTNKQDDKPSNETNTYKVDLSGLDASLQAKVDSIVTEVKTTNGTFMLSLTGDEADMSNVKDVTINKDGIFLTVGGKQVKVTSNLPTTNIDFKNARAMRLVNGVETTVAHYIEGDSLKVTSNNLTDIVVKEKVEVPFKDVQENQWYHADVKDAYNYGIVKGTTADTFNPNGAITRGQFATMIARALEITPQDTFSNYKLSDIKGKWYADAVQTLVERGIITGYADGTFGGEETLTRQQAVVMVTRMLEYMGVDTSVKSNVTFKDINNISDYAREAAQFLASQDILNNGANTQFNPYNNLTRAQMAKILMRSLRLSDNF